MFCLPMSVLSQMQVDWQQCYCSMESDQANGIVQQNNGYLVMGTQLGGDGQVNCSSSPSSWLLRITGTGEIEWQKCYLEKDARLMFQEYDGFNNYVIGGAMMEPYPDEANLWIAKIDSLGEIIWERVVGNNDGISNYHFFGAPSNDGGIVGTVLIFSQGGDITNWYGGYDIDNVKYPSWKLVSRNRKQWMDKSTRLVIKSGFRRVYYEIIW